MSTRLHLAQLHGPWTEAAAGPWTVRGVGRSESVQDLAAALPPHGRVEADELGRILHGIKGHYAAVAESPSSLVAAVDRTRSYPLFHAAVPDGLAVSDDARALQQELGLSALDDLSLLEFAMAGYVTGPDTLYAGLAQLEPGQCLVHDKDAGSTVVLRYYRYLPEPRDGRSEEELLEELDRVMDRVFARLCAEAAGRPVWVPLSGGLDSRLIACKLQELDYGPVHTFSYGPPGNHEARIAAQVAERLGLSWTFHPSRRRAWRDLFAGPERRAYWGMASGLCAAPNMQEFLALLEMRRAGALPDGVVLVNGQSGDFITGGHLKPALLTPQAGMDEVVRAVVAKHYSLWKSLMTRDNLARVEDKLRRLLAEPGQGSPAARYEMWEWQERQCKFVVNQQRTYEYFGLPWLLPLWYDELYDFWATVPPGHKLDQGLFKRWLARYDHRGLFRDFSPVVSRWPGATRFLVWPIRLAGAVGGARFKERLYRSADYLGHYGPWYGMYPAGYYLRRAGDARNPGAFYSRTWMQENLPGKDFPGAGGR